MTASQQSLHGKRVLVVEDEMLVALLIEDMLVDLGCVIIGPFNAVDKALAAAAKEPVDLALLDVNVAGEKVYPVAETLAGRRIPFLFLSGYGDTAIPAGRTDWKVCSKPFRGSELTDMLAAMLASEPA